MIIIVTICGYHGYDPTCSEFRIIEYQMINMLNYSHLVEENGWTTVDARYRIELEFRLLTYYELYRQLKAKLGLGCMICSKFMTNYWDFPGC